MSFVSMNREKKFTAPSLCCDTNLVFEDKVLRRIFGPKRGEVKGEWKKITL